MHPITESHCPHNQCFRTAVSCNKLPQKQTYFLPQTLGPAHGSENLVARLAGGVPASGSRTFPQGSEHVEAYEAAHGYESPD